MSDCHIIHTLFWRKNNETNEQSEKKHAAFNRSKIKYLENNVQD